MLVLSRHRDESIIIGDDIVITVVDIRGDKVRLGIAAPIEISVHRQEVYEAIQRENRQASRLEPQDARQLDNITPPLRRDIRRTRSYGACGPPLIRFQLRPARQDASTRPRGRVEVATKVRCRLPSTAIEGISMSGASPLRLKLARCGARPRFAPEKFAPHRPSLNRGQ